MGGCFFAKSGVEFRKSKKVGFRNSKNRGFGTQKAGFSRSRGVSELKKCKKSGVEFRKEKSRGFGSKGGGGWGGWVSKIRCLSSESLFSRYLHKRPPMI